MARQQRSTTLIQESTRPIARVALYARVSTLLEARPFCFGKIQVDHDLQSLFQQFLSLLVQTRWKTEELFAAKEIRYALPAGIAHRAGKLRHAIRWRMRKQYLVPRESRDHDRVVCCHQDSRAAPLLVVECL